MTTKYSTEGCNYGDFGIENKHLQLTSITSGENMPLFNIPCDQIAQCVVPQSNRDELEIQFGETGREGKHEDRLMQMTVHFPPIEDPDEDTTAEALQSEIMKMGVITSLTGDVLAEFSKEWGNFVNPRGKYALQLTSSHLHMQGSTYSYKIKYDDINCFYLLDKPDKTRYSIIIALEKPIRQGNQKYSNLVIDTHKLEDTVKLNISQEDCENKYQGQLEPEMTMPTSNILAKCFKVLAGKKVLIPKQFVSLKGDMHCVKALYKTQDGLLYPLAKAFVYIHKPTVIIPFESIEYIEFKRYDPKASFETRNFDMQIIMKSPLPGEPKEYTFQTIERAEYVSLFDYCNAKNIPIKNPQQPGVALKGDGLGEDDLDDEDDEEDDGDYDGGSGSESSDGEDDDDSVASDASGDAAVGGSKKRKSSSSKKDSRKSKNGEKVTKKGKRAKKDKNAPKGALSAYMLFGSSQRPIITAEMGKMPVTDMSKEISLRWNQLSPIDKAPFEEQAAADKVRYQTEMKAYKAASAADADADSDAGSASD